MYLYRNFIKKDKSFLLRIKSGIFILALLALNLFVGAASAQQFTVTGVTSDESDELLTGVTVAVKGTNTGVMSDTDGKYSITVPGSDAVLVFSYVGYEQQEITVGSRTVINVQLKSSTELDEVVVTALGITREAKALGYAVTTISAKELTKVGSPNFATALYGKASGVRIQNTQGGSAGGVSIAVRGLSSFNGNTQPLIVMNGVPIRNGNATNGSDVVNNNDIATKDFASIGSGGRIRSNGLVDINPEDIESLTILKGAAATALYGSEAANGAIIISSKKASAKGVTVDVNATFQVNTVATVPKIQDKYGPGDIFDSWSGNFQNGFATNAATGSLYPNYGTSSNWGPAYDGREVLYVDGKTRAYSPYSAEPWKELFRTGSNQIYNVAINHGGDKSNTRFSYTYADEVPNSLSGSYNKHNFNMVGTLKFNDRLSVDYTGNYIVQNFKNRPQASINVYNSYDDAFGSFLDISLLKTLYKTADGYRNSAQGSWTPSEYAPIDAVGADRFVNGVRMLLWNIHENQSEETESRFISSVSPTWKVTDWFTVRARMATDYTTTEQEERNRSQYPATAKPNTGDEVSGAYTTLHKSYRINYGDVMLVFNKDLTDDINLNANLGWQGRSEKMNALFAGTSRGLAVDNVFQLSNGKAGSITPDGNTNRKMELLKTAFVGTVGASYGGFIYVDVTGRQDKSSTLPKGNRDFFYPSASASFLYTEAFGLPSWYDFGKLRLSYGIVGNAPEAYAANVAYEVKSDPGGFISDKIPESLGNKDLKPETTKEFEIGIESKFFKNRLGFEVSYYSREITDMLFQVPLAATSGSKNVWTNSGTMTNSGVEATVYATPVETRDFSWDLRVNLGFNENKIKELAPGVNHIETGSYGGVGTIGKIYSSAGSTMGDYLSSDYIRVQNTMPDKPYYDASGQYVGQRVVDENGNYRMTSELVKLGNAMPKVVGGLGTSLNYKNLSLDIMTDFRAGGYVFNSMYYLTMNRGINADTENREGEGFYDFTNGQGEARQNGIILDGVVDNGNGGFAPNEKIISYDSYISTAYGINSPGNANMTAGNALSKNTWWKVREMALSYTFPKSVIPDKVFRNLTLSVFGRNLFYIYKSIPGYDPETSNGTDWKSQLLIGGSASPTRTFGISLRASF